MFGNAYNDTHVPGNKFDNAMLCYKHLGSIGCVYYKE